MRHVSSQDHHTMKTVVEATPVRVRERAALADFVQLTKPTIMLLVVFTGAAALVVEGSFITRPLDFVLVLIGLYLTGGCANALNQYLERHIDARMTRTRERRPLPMGKLTPGQALTFAIGIGVAGVILLATVFNLLTAGLALATILFYSLFYTLYLKPTTPQNIVIGGAAGAMAPVGAWAAATGGTAATPWVMFAIILLWTPPHFWALAMFYKDDYVRAGYPMMPIVHGDDSTLRQILWYTVALVVSSLALIPAGAGWIYGVAALALGGRLVQLGVLARRVRTEKSYRALFGYSIIYLFALFLAMMVDAHL